MAVKTNADREIDRLQPPQSLDAEQAVLGAVLKDEDAIHIVADTLDSESCFYLAKHQMIYRVVLLLYSRSEPCDIVTVANALAASGQLDQIGGRSYLVDLAESSVSSANVRAHADIVYSKFLLRRLIQTSNEISRSAHDVEGPVEDILDAAEGNIFRISEGRLKHGFVHISSLAKESLAQIERIQQDKSILDGVLTGFEEIDKLTQGLHNGDFVVIAGRPSMGKSALALNIAENVAGSSGEKKAVAVFSIEMSKEQLTLRMLCGRAKLNQQKIRSHHLSDADWFQLVSHGDRIAHMDILIDDSAALTSLQMRAKARRLKAQYPHLSLIVVDYIQMMHASGQSENRQQEISVISRNLKALAKELSVPVVACSQLSRMVEHRGGDKRPVLADLRESGAIEQDADVVMFVFRPEYYLSADERSHPPDQKTAEKLGVAEIIIAKQRNGPTGTAKLAFISEFARFANLAAGHREIPSDAEPVGGDTPF